MGTSLGNGPSGPTTGYLLIWFFHREPNRNLGFCVTLCQPQSVQRPASTGDCSQLGEKSAMSRRLDVHILLRVGPFRRLHSRVAQSNVNAKLVGGLQNIQWRPSIHGSHSGEELGPCNQARSGFAFPDSPYKLCDPRPVSEPL